MNWSARAPSIRRWSKLSEMWQMCRMAMASSITTGVLSTVPTPRMATCGWLMTGVPNRLPKLPKLVMENVPPGHFVGLELARAGARGQVDDGALQAQHGLLVGERITGTIRPPSSATAMPILISLW